MGAPAATLLKLTLLTLTLAACAQLQPQTPAPQTWQPAPFTSLPGWNTDQVAQTIPGLQAQCHRLLLLNPETSLGGQGIAATLAGRAGLWRPACTAALALAPTDELGTRHFYEAWFQPYRLTTPGLFTGYYEPEVRGARTPMGAYQTPLLARPTDLLQTPPPASDPNGPPRVSRLEGGALVPYWTRAEIEAGMAGAATHPILYVSDPVDAFFLQIQGAGRVRLPDGTLLRVAYDGKNGRPYTPIGRTLVDQGALAEEDLSMQSIRAWLLVHPLRAKSVMDSNQDYVFFRILPGNDTASGPPGALGVSITPWRSAAVDRHAIPLGAPIFADTTTITGTPWQHLLLAQDLGAGVVGAARIDIFMGTGPLAEQQAGHMNQRGTAYVLLPRPPA